MKQYDVVVIGSGITGLSVAWHLKQLGVAKVAVCGDEFRTTQSALASGIVCGGLIDNFTRVTHAHGKGFAKEFWQFGHFAFGLLEQFAGASGIPFTPQPRYRLITSDAELKEATLATQQLQNAGFHATLVFPKEDEALFSRLGERVLAVQVEKRGAADCGGFISPSQLLEALDRHDHWDRHPTVKELQMDHAAKNAPVHLTLEGGATLKSELVVAACHLAIGKLIPNLEEALVSVADQWCDYEVEASEEIPACVYSANHTYEWGAPMGEGSWRIGGGRFLRPMAGIEAKSAVAEEKIDQFLQNQFQRTFPSAKKIALKQASGFLDCRPCDELPIIGPMYGESRLLVSTGYMGSGLTLGLAAGLCLAEIIVHGRSDHLPRRLWPERLRSLEVR